MAYPATADREYAPLLAIRDSHPKYVLSLDRLADSGRSGVHQPQGDDRLDEPSSCINI